MIFDSQRRAAKERSGTLYSLNNWLTVRMMRWNEYLNESCCQGDDYGDHEFCIHTPAHHERQMKFEEDLAALNTECLRRK